MSDARTAEFYNALPHGSVETPDDPKPVASDDALAARQLAIYQGRLATVAPDEFAAWKQRQAKTVTEIVGDERVAHGGGPKPPVADEKPVEAPPAPPAAPADQAPTPTDQAIDPA